MEQEEIEAKILELSEKVAGYEASLAEKDQLISNLEEKYNQAETARKQLAESRLQEIDNRIPVAPMSYEDSMVEGALKVLIPKYYGNDTKL